MACLSPSLSLLSLVRLWWPPLAAALERPGAINFVHKVLISNGSLVDQHARATAAERRGAVLVAEAYVEVHVAQGSKAHHLF